MPCEELIRISVERVKVFVGEQDSAYLEVDEEDFDAKHVMIKNEGTILGYARILEDDLKIQAGRVLILKEYRGKGLGNLCCNTY